MFKFRAVKVYLVNVPIHSINMADFNEERVGDFYHLGVKSISARLTF